MDFDIDFNFENEIKDLGMCTDFIDMDESQWDYVDDLIKKKDKYDVVYISNCD